MLKPEDKVEEIATGLQGEIIVIASDGSRGNGIPTKWEVRFGDGTTKTFHDDRELKSLMEESGGFSPADPIQG